MLHNSGKSHLATVVGEEGETECGAGDEGDSHLPQHRKALAGVGFYLIEIVANSVQIRKRLPAILGISTAETSGSATKTTPLLERASISFAFYFF